MNDDQDLKAFEALYDEHFPRVWAYAVSRAGVQAAEEVVSDTFLVAWQHRSRLPTEALPWLLGVARNVLRDSARKGRRREALTAQLRLWAQSEPTPDVASSVVDRAALFNALSTLPDADREVLTLVAWGGLDHRGAARVLGCTQVTLRVRVHRARNRLRRELGRQGGETQGTAPAPYFIRTEEMTS
jgi:RNA polymerase sigma-70 factor (ECF subfamily)